VILFTVSFAFPSVALWPMEYGWEESVGDGVIFTVADAFVVMFVDTFVFTVVDVFVFTTVVGTGIVVTTVVSAGTVVCVVLRVGSAVMGFLSSVVSEGVVADWLVPDIIPGIKTAAATRKRIITIAMRPHFRRGLRLFSCTGTSFPPTGMSATSVPGTVFFGDG
jgi:hypothetical protein